jgi:hypothetical protein
LERHRRHLTAMAFSIGHMKRKADKLITVEKHPAVLTEPTRMFMEYREV